MRRGRRLNQRQLAELQLWFLIYLSQEGIYTFPQEEKNKINSNPY